MSDPQLLPITNSIPPGYATVSIVPQQKAPLQICVVVRNAQDAGPIVLRDTMDARILLGCVIDAAGQVHRWLEIWVQTLTGLSQITASVEGALSNRVLDLRWQTRAKAFANINPELLVRTGWETLHPPATWIDVKKMETVQPLDEQTQKPWRLCTDDALLSKANLDPYSSSLHRYLHVPERGEQTPFVALTEGAKSSPAVQPMSAITQDRKDLVALNASGGLMMVRAFVPSTIDHVNDVLNSGAKLALAPSGPDAQATAAPIGAGNLDGTRDGHGWLFLSQRALYGRLAEAFHLKLRLFADAVSAVHAMVLACKQPILNLTAESFRVEFGRPGFGLPLLWTARTVLVDSSDALEFTVPGGDVRYYTPGRRITSIYQPLSAGQIIAGRSAVRIAKMNRSETGVSVDGTFETHERVAASGNDMVRLWINIGGDRVHLYARLDSKQALAGGQWAFSTVPQKVDKSIADALGRSQGITLPDTRFELVPQLSTPVDMYSLAVLAVRSFLLNTQNTLPVALDETLSLARQLAQDLRAAGEAAKQVSPIPDRIVDIVKRDERFLNALGPHRLINDPMEPQDALDAIPSELWWDTIGLIVRMFPGIGPDSFCQDFGHAPPSALHRIFQPVLEGLTELLVRSRSLILVDWKYNREIHAVIRSRLTGSA